MYIIHPSLNIVLKSISQKEYCILCLVFLFLYCGIGFIVEDAFFASSLVYFIGVYFLIGYIKIYKKSSFEKSTVYRTILCLCCFCVVGMFVVTDCAGIKITRLSDDLLKWSVNCNPFLLFSAISLFFCFKKFTFSSKIVNYISSLSLLIYLIHENILY